MAGQSEISPTPIAKSLVDIKWLDDRIALLAILVLALALRLPGLSESLWYDETWSTAIRLGSFKLLVYNAVLADVHPPLYSAFMYVWINLFGDGEISIRLPSLVGGLAAITLTFLIVRRLFGSYPALLAAALMALSPVHIWYSGEARSYAVLMALVLLAVYAYVRLEEAPPRGRWLFVYLCASLAAALTHFYGSAFVGAMSLLALRRAPVRRWPVFVAGAICLTTMAVYLLGKLAIGNVQTSISHMRHFDLFEFWTVLFHWFPTGNAIWQVSFWDKDFSIFAETPALLATHLIFFVLFATGVVGSLQKSNPGSLAARLDFLILFAVLPTALFVLTAAGFDKLALERSLLPVMPFFFAYVGRGMVSLPLRPLRVVSLVAVATIMAVSLGNFFTKDSEWTVYKPNPDWRAASAYLAGELETDPGAKLVIMATPPDVLMYYDRRFKRITKEEVSRLSEGTPASPASGDDSAPKFWVQRVLGSAQLPARLPVSRIYLLYVRHWSAGIEAVRQHLTKCRGFQVVATHSVQGVDIHALERAAAGSASDQDPPADCRTDG